MTQSKFHLGWFTHFSVDEWLDPLSSAGGNPWSGEFYVELAQTLERACFDFLMLEDTLMVPDVFAGSSEPYLRSSIHVPKHDPAPLAAVMSSRTNRIGVVATLSTLAYPPFLLARLCATLDHIARGRFGWNIVTSGEDLAAQNFGLAKITAHDLRYDMADEYLDLVNKLFASWDADAIVRDQKAEIYADHTKVHPIHFKGRFYNCRGPLNTAPMPQGRPAYIQAGGSPRGRDFAAKHADCIVAKGNGIASMKAIRDDIRNRAKRLGRNPDEIKVLYLFAPVLGSTEQEAKAVNERGLASERFQERILAFQSAVSGIDFSKFDRDKPLPDLSTEGSIAVLSDFAQFGSGKTLRQLIVEGGKGTSVESVGTPDQIAEQMAEVMRAVGGDGFLIIHPFYNLSRRYVLEVAEGLVPALQRRGLLRNEYTKATLRETLREF